MQRRDFLVGTLTGLATGVGLEKLVAYEKKSHESGGANSNILPWYWQFAHPSFAQQGEDLIINSIFQNHLKINKPSFIDIGAYHPIYSNNTYLLYLQGSRGVLVEPNPAYTELLKSVRKEDTVLNIGIGITNDTEADYYVFDKNSQLNTFSKERVDEYIKKYGPDILKEVVKMPLVNINQVLEEHFTDTPNIFSIDVEGLDLDILKTLDFERYRPNLFCVETSVYGTFHVDDEITNFMETKGYTMRANTFTNSIYVDKQLLSS